LNNLPDYLIPHANEYRYNTRVKNKPHTRADYAQHMQIINKRGELVHFEPNRVQSTYMANRGQKNLALKARQQGLSSVVVWDGTLEAMTQTSFQAVLAHDSVTTEKMRSLSRFYYDSLPAHMKPKRTRDNATKTTYAHTSSEVTIVTAGSANTGRGGTYHRIHGSEVAYWKDAPAIIAGLMQGLTPDGSVDFEGTANGAQGWFYDQCMRAMDGDTEWTFHFFPWYWMQEYATPLTDDEKATFTLSTSGSSVTLSEHELVHEKGLSLEQIKWRRAKKRELPFTFEQEYPETAMQAFISGGQSVFGDIRHAVKWIGARQGVPTAKHRYVAGIDWGQDNDYTAISVMDATTNEEVHISHFNKMPWGEMRSIIADICIHWGVETVQPERNNMSANIEELKKLFNNKGFRTNTRSVDTNNSKKSKWVHNLYKALHDEGLRLLDPEDNTGVRYATHELNAFIQTQLPSGVYKYGAMNGKHDDTVMARMLALDAVNRMVW